MISCYSGLTLILMLCQEGWTAQVSAVQYYVTPPTSFRGVDPDLSGCIPNGGVLQCTNNGILTDSNTIPPSVNLNSPEYVQLFLPWSEAVEKPYISFSFIGEQTVATVGLSFLNYPSEMVGLPNLRVFQTDSPTSRSGGTEIIYTLRNNGELTSGDQKVATVYLDLFPASGVTLAFVRIEISFSGLYNTDYFLLNEVTFESTRIDADFPTISFDSADTNLQVFPGHTLQLTCTLTVDGQFEWKWMRGDQTLVDSSQVQMETALATRTGVLTITDICTTNSGTYTCEARHVGTSSFRRHKSRTTVVTVSSSALVEVGTPVTGLFSVDLTCFVSGYQGNPADITWAREDAPDAPLQDSSPKYTIARSNQTLGGGVSGCSSVSVNVTMTIHNLASGDTGRYICSAGADSQATTTLTVLDPSLPATPTGQASSTTTSSTSPAVPPVTPGSSNAPKGEGCSCSSSSGATAAVASGVTIVLTAMLVSVVVHILLVVYLVKKRQKADLCGVFGGATQSVQAVNLSQDGVYEDIDQIGLDDNNAAIATKANEAYGHVTQAV